MNGRAWLGTVVAGALTAFGCVATGTQIDDGTLCPVRACEYAVPLDPEGYFTPEETNALLIAINAWQDSTGRRLCFKDREDGISIRVLRDEAEIADLDHMPGPDYARGGIYREERTGLKWIAVVPSRTTGPDNLAAMFAHELGHALLGFAEYEGAEPSIMGKPGELRSGDLVPLRDRRAYCDRHGCGCHE